MVGAAGIPIYPGVGVCAFPHVMGWGSQKNSRPALRLNIGKCKTISYSRRPELNTNYSISGVTVENMKDLGVVFDNKLKFDKHINNKINTAYQMLGIEIVLLFYIRQMIRSHLEYAVSV